MGTRELPLEREDLRWRREEEEEEEEEGIG